MKVLEWRVLAIRHIVDRLDIAEVEVTRHIDADVRHRPNWFTRRKWNTLGLRNNRHVPSRQAECGQVTHDQLAERDIASGRTL